MTTSARALGTCVFTKPIGEFDCTQREGQAPPLRYDEKRKRADAVIGPYKRFTCLYCCGEGMGFDMYGHMFVK